MSKYDDMLKKSEGDGKIWNRYGLTESQWAQLTTEEREIHYRRMRICNHQYEYLGIEVEPGVFIRNDDRLKDEYSFDPYFHTAHMAKCQRPTVSIDECPCPMCALKIGIVDYKPMHKVDAEAVRLKLRKRLTPGG